MALKGPYTRLDIRSKIPNKDLQAQIGQRPTDSDVHRQRWDTINRIAFDGEREIWWIDGRTAQSLNWPNFGARGGVNQIILKCSQGAIDNIKGWSRRSTYVKQVVDNSKRDSITIMFDIQPVKFEATGKVITTSGKKISEAAMTRMQEAGSAAVFRQSIKYGKKFTSPDAIKKDNDTMRELKAIWGRESVPDVGMEWINNFYKQNKLLLTKTSQGSFTEFNHTGGFMDFISNFVKTEFKISKKDNWNPADIWLINDDINNQKEIERIVKGYDGTGNKIRGRWHIEDKLDKLNALMRSYFKGEGGKPPKIWGISLKKVSGDEAYWQELNVDDKFFDDLAIKKMKFDHILSKFDYKTLKNGRVSMASQDSRFVVKEGQNEYDFQIKSNNSSEEGNLKYEPTDKGATAARLGKATAAYVEGLLVGYGISDFDKSWSDYPQDVDTFIARGDEFKAYLKIMFNHSLFKTDLTGSTQTKVDTAYSNLLTVFAEENTPWVANSKCMQMAWIAKVLSEIKDKEKKDAFATDIVFLAKKEGPRYGPFAKIY